ncbi:hypothetical protein DYB32_005857 [Aphanomyces invadans]|uniref:UBC core domain-containing protein n=1 Tax=Aphanomyces invadans TaxID=157072 RepID=A0A3R6Z2S4_9STRA|nr:hypothetical protein DYB32_005857 [Aphanomyces invadans]
MIMLKKKKEQAEREAAAAAAAAAPAPPATEDSVPALNDDANTRASAAAPPAPGGIKIMGLGRGTRKSKEKKRTPGEIRIQKVRCMTKIYHPNIDLDGNVCLNILREDWKPVLDINAVIYGLIYLFYEPNPDDPLNREAAEMFRSDPRRFQDVVGRSLRGQYVQGIQFERLV